MRRFVASKIQPARTAECTPLLKATYGRTVSTGRVGREQVP